MTDDTTADPATTPTQPATASGPPAPAPAPAATAMRSPWPVLVPVIVGVAALLLGAFVGGAIGYGVGNRPGPVMVHQLPDAPRFDGPGDRDRREGAPFGLDRSDFATGTLTSVSDDEIVIELENGDTITYFLDDDTDVVEVNAATVDDLTEGEQVTVVANPRGDDRTARIIRTGDGLLPLGGSSTEG